MTTIIGYKNMQEYRIVVQYKNEQGRFVNDEIILASEVLSHMFEICLKSGIVV